MKKQTVEKKKFSLTIQQAVQMSIPGLKRQ